jgi:putative copper resistance protein D
VVVVFPEGEEEVTLPSRQGLEQVAVVLVLGALAFALVAAWRWRRGRSWRRHATSAGILGGITTVVLAVAYTVAPNIPVPPVPFTARFAQDPVPNTPEAIEAGRQTYVAKCAICHGQRGRGDGPAALTMNPRPFDLIVHVPQHPPGEVHYWISEGVAGTQMPAWKDELSDTQRWQLVRFLEALASGRT